MEKWLKLYPSTPMSQYGQVCDGYSCAWCSRCPRGENWKVPEEDLAEYNEYQAQLKAYYDLHGGIDGLCITLSEEEK